MPPTHTGPGFAKKSCSHKNCFLSFTGMSSKNSLFAKPSGGRQVPTRTVATSSTGAPSKAPSTAVATQPSPQNRISVAQKATEKVAPAAAVPTKPPAGSTSQLRPTVTAPDSKLLTQPAPRVPVALPAPETHATDGGSASKVADKMRNTVSFKSPPTTKLPIGCAPVASPFPDVLPKAVTSVLDGTTLERPYTTDMYKEYSESGFYACVRCRTPMVAAADKIPMELGFAGFQRFHVQACLVSVSSRDDHSELQVRCKTCNAFVGILTQDVPPTAMALCSTGEVLKVNSCALHFLSTPLAMQWGNYFIGDTQAARLDGDDGDDLLDFDDFNDLDVIGTEGGALRAAQRRKQLHSTFIRQSAPESSSSKSVTAAASNNITYNQRHHLQKESVLEYSDEEACSDDGGSDETDEGRD